MGLYKDWLGGITAIIIAIVLGLFFDHLGTAIGTGVLAVGFIYYAVNIRQDNISKKITRGIGGTLVLLSLYNLFFAFLNFVIPGTLDLALSIITLGAFPIVKWILAVTFALVLDGVIISELESSLKSQGSLE